MFQFFVASSSNPALRPIFPTPGSTLPSVCCPCDILCIFCICFFVFHFWPPLAWTLWFFPGAFTLFGLLFGFMISAWLWTLFIWILYFCFSECLPDFLDLCLCFWIVPHACHLIKCIFYSYPQSVLGSLSLFLTLFFSHFVW